ncbi:MAG: phosphoribosylglycinamide formyltransferase [Clostridiales Family XIII bacterium]|nr:phosphoribosylglycinamide formyltransferase [Clostridiales Family XIII bacterium]
MHNNATAGDINISVLVSGGGSNLQSIIDGIADGRIRGARVSLVISSKEGAYALKRAERVGASTAVVSRDEYPDADARASRLAELLSGAETDMVVLAGYMHVVPPGVVSAYSGRIINIHPSLIPKHCGMGYYGRRVHESVLAAGDSESGATVHYVDEGVDTGAIIVQERVPVEPGDTPDTLAARVLDTEHVIIVKAVAMVADALRER